MVDEIKKTKRSRRVNRKRKALSTAKKLSTVPLVLNICHDTLRDLWQVLVVDAITKRKIAKGPLREGKNKAYDAFHEELEKELDNRTE